MCSYLTKYNRLKKFGRVKKGEKSLTDYYHATLAKLFNKFILAQRLKYGGSPSADAVALTIDKLSLYCARIQHE